ncbi:F5/8 type C domain-containing protein [Brevibacillus sp. IT-7CA2]|uniref:discoidin domain-containing protein n=1 Tax=Brevibacillus sp. IT-7CA2 TaxID=3026436 RepID=UPI0039E0D4B8
MTKVRKAYAGLCAVVLVAMLILNPTSTNASTQYSEDIVPQLSSNTSGNITVSSSGIYAPDHDAWKAFNNQIDDRPWSTENKNTKGWLKIDFGSNNEKQVAKYTIQMRVDINGDPRIPGFAPKAWTFEGSNDDSNWVILDTHVDETDWEAGQKREYTFSNTDKYQYYRISISENNGEIVSNIAEMELMEKANIIDPNPEPEPTGDHALLVIKMISGLEKEFELSSSEVQDFIDWYNGRADGRGKETYMFDKDFNKGPFTARKDYVAFSKIQSFEVMEYTK